MTNQSRKILVYGGNSAQGLPVIKRLLNEGYKVRVFVRNAENARKTLPVDVEIATGTLEDVESLKRASKGIDRVFLILPLEFRIDVAINQGKNAIEAARETGVDLIVFNTSSLVPEKKTSAVAFEVKRTVKQYLHQSGIPFIVLSPTVYMDNLAAPWSFPNIQNSVVAYPLPPEVKVSWISLEDTAAFAVEALKRPELSGSDFSIGGLNAVNGLAIASQFSEVFDRPFTYQQIPIDGFAQGLNQAFGEPSGTEIANIYRWLMAHPEDGIVDTSKALAELPVQLTSFKEWIQNIQWDKNLF